MRDESSPWERCEKCAKVPLETRIHLPQSHQRKTSIGRSLKKKSLKAHISPSRNPSSSRPHSSLNFLRLQSVLCWIYIFNLAVAASLWINRTLPPHYYIAQIAFGAAELTRRSACRRTIFSSHQKPGAERQVEWMDRERELERCVPIQSMVPPLCIQQDAEQFFSFCTSLMRPARLSFFLLWYIASLTHSAPIRDGSFNKGVNPILPQHPDPFLSNWVYATGAVLNGLAVCSWEPIFT